MKRVSIAVLALVAMSMASCKKDYTCTCTVNGDELKTEFKDTQKGVAEKSCDKAEASYRSQFPETVCSLD